LSERGIGVEACPVSNLRTNVIASIGEHPIREFMERGIKVSVNSDDPSMFNTDMNNEYLALHRKLSFTVPELYRISLNALETSFLPEDRKAQLRETFQREYGRLAQS
jgi:adenosine deaminase